MSIQPGTAYVQDCVFDRRSNLYSLDLSTGKATLIGAIATEVTDIAFAGDQLYGLDQKEGKHTQLIKIDPKTGRQTVIGDIGFYAIGLTYSSDRKTLYASTAKQLVAININTGAGTPVITVANQDYNCGEVAFNGNKTYITLIGYDKKKILATCDLDTGTVTHIGDIGFPNIGSMEFYDGVLYGVTGNFFNLGTDGQLIKIDTTTGAGTLVTMTDPIGRWAGISIYQATTEAISPQRSPQIEQPNEETVREPQIVVDSYAQKVAEQKVQDTLPQEVVGSTTQAEAKFEPTEIKTPQPSPHPVAASTSQTASKPVTKEVETRQPSTTKGTNMSILTIDAKDNCYVINQGQMNDLQDRVAKSVELERGNYNISIESGRYSYATTTEGEPFVLLWIYGINESTFVNKTTGFETGATWTTLNGYNDTLQLEVKERIRLCALFLDVDNTNSSGSVTLSIKSDNSSNPISLTVDSKQNTYLLDQGYLTPIKQWGSNFNALNPGKYEIKITDGKFGYWAENKKFELEPWALIWVKGGKFITKQTGVEVEQTWCSLNGYNDQVVLDVKETTTLCGLFFDTHKEDNQGRITISIEPFIPTSTTSTLSFRTYDYFDITFDSFARNPQADIVCVTPVRSIIRREEEITIIRRVRKVEEIDASPACPVNTTQVSGQ